MFNFSKNAFKGFDLPSFFEEHSFTTESIFDLVEKGFGFPRSEINQLQAITGIPAANVRKVDGGTEYQIVAPGFEKDAFTIEVEGSILKVSFKAEQETGDNDQSYSRREFIQNSFSRSFNLATGIDPAGITADYVNGVLKMFVPGQEPATKAKHLVKIR